MNKPIMSHIYAGGGICDPMGELKDPINSTLNDTRCHVNELTVQISFGVVCYSQGPASGDLSYNIICDDGYQAHEATNSSNPKFCQDCGAGWDGAAPVCVPVNESHANGSTMLLLYYIIVVNITLLLVLHAHIFFFRHNTPFQ